MKNSKRLPGVRGKLNS